MPPATVFQCRAGAKQATVTSVGRTLRYRFGRPERPEIALTGDPARGTVRYHRELYAHSENKQLRFVSGAVDYLLWHRWASPNYEGRYAEDRSGLVVRRGGRVVARIACRGGDFSTRYDWSRLPDDGEDVTGD